MNWLHILYNNNNKYWTPQLGIEHTQISVNKYFENQKQVIKWFVRNDERKKWERLEVCVWFVDCMNENRKWKKRKDEKHLTKVYIEHIDIIGVVSIDRHAHSVQCSLRLIFACAYIRIKCKKQFMRISHVICPSRINL